MSKRKAIKRSKNKVPYPDLSEFSFNKDNGYYFRKLLRDDPDKALWAVFLTKNPDFKGALQTDYPLHAAVVERQDEIVKALVKKGATLDVRNKEGMTPLMVAVQRFASDELIDFLIKSGADVRLTDSNRRTILHQTRDPERIEKFVNLGADINVASFDEGTLLHRAVTENNMEMAEFLLQKNALTSVKRPKDGNTPLHLASTREMASFLLENKADINALNEDKKTPLHLAIEHGSEALAAFYLEKGADALAVDSSGNTPLEIACYNGMPKIAEALIKKGAKTDKRDYTDRNLLFEAKNAEIVDLLVKNNVSVTHLDEDRKTPLHTAKSKEVALALLKHGADIEARDEHGETPLHSAIDHGRYDVAEALVEQGAHIIYNQTIPGLSPLEYAENQLKNNKNMSEAEKMQLEALIDKMRQKANGFLLGLHDIGLAKNEEHSQTQGGLSSLLRQNAGSDITADKEQMEIVPHKNGRSMA